MRRGRIIVVGGGVIGTCAAFFLTRRGARVVVLERDAIGGGASFGNAGSIAPGHAPINKPGRMTLALRWMFADTSPLYVSPRVDPQLLRWLWAFHRHNTPKHLEHCMRVLAPLGRESQRLFDHLVRDEHLDCDYRRQGYYEVYRTERGLADGWTEARHLRTLGLAPRLLSGDEMREREPSLLDSIRGAIWHEEASTCNPHRFVTELAKRAMEAGAEFRTGGAVTALRVANRAVVGVSVDGQSLDADAVLLATGAYSQELLEPLDFRMPLQPAKGYHRDSSPTAGGAPPLGVPCLLGESFIFCTPLDGFVRLAGTLEFSGLNHHMRASRLRQLTVGARSYFGQVGEEGTLSEWCGLRPCLPDGLPALGPVPGYRGIYVANGHAMMGLTLGPVSGLLAAEMMLGDPTSLDVSSLGPARFGRRGSPTGL